MCRAGGRASGPGGPEPASTAAVRPHHRYARLPQRTFDQAGVHIAHDFSGFRADRAEDASDCVDRFALELVVAAQLLQSAGGDAKFAGHLSWSGAGCGREGKHPRKQAGLLRRVGNLDRHARVAVRVGGAATAALDDGLDRHPRDNERLEVRERDCAMDASPSGDLVDGPPTIWAAPEIVRDPASRQFENGLRQSLVSHRNRRDYIVEAHYLFGGLGHGKSC